MRQGDSSARIIARRFNAETAGFTLFEVLAAITLLAVGISLAASLIGLSMGNIRKTEARARMIEYAGSVMELTLLDQKITEPGTLNGDFADGTRWTVRIDEYVPEEETPPARADMPVKLLAYTVEVFPPGSGVADYRLQTLKLAPALQMPAP